MTGPITVFIANSQLAERERLRKQLADCPDIQVVGEAPNDRECIEAVLRQRPQVVLIQEELPVSGGLQVAQQLSERAGEVSVILVLVNPAGEEMWHKMLRDGIREFITRSTPADLVAEEIRRVAKLQRPHTAAAIADDGKPKNQIITVAAPRGGTGKTVIATNLAVALASRHENVALLDLNLVGGDVAVLLDLIPQRTLGDLMPTFVGIDDDVMDSVMVKHACGLRVVPAPLNGMYDSSLMSRPLVQNILRFLRMRCNYTVVDTGYPSLESTLAAMDASDIILVVVGNDLPRLRDGKQYLRNLIAANYPKERIRLIANRTGVTKEIPTKEIESILKFPVTAMLPNDDELVGMSVNLGQPFVLSSPNKSLSKILANLADSLSVAADANQKKRKSVFTLFA
ncbi:MAG: MinD/ParA family protein [Verrucomicrobia bacterium]|nr:MinD/ParA family protein [Verrucomicrobiota bacterium]